MKPLVHGITWGLLAAAFALLGYGAEFPPPYDSEKEQKARPLAPEEAAKGFEVPKGFQVSVFAAEPEVMNPIAFGWDTKGRLWVAENFTYAERPLRFDLNLRDRVLIFEDRDGDGRPEKRTVFFDEAQRLTGLAVGLGGVWLMCPPQLLFVPDRDGDDKPDGPAEVVLDGFDVPRENYHNFANGLKWGPDGWLYGRCGASCPGLIRRPDQPLSQAIPLAGTIWRYHPTRKVFEALSSGTTNPWGHDWDAHGECFFINTVNGHLWHMIPGAHYRRPHTIDPNPLAYEPIEQHADHWHWAAGEKEWIEPGTLRHVNMDQYGGGHAHSGCLIYQGPQWPKSFHGKLLTLNFHGRRVNVDRLERLGSGYVGRHEPDILKSNDLFFRGIDLETGQDGSVFILDWSDIGECHEYTGVHRTSGRIYRVSYGPASPRPTPDLTRLPLEELAEHACQSTSVWHERLARLELMNRRLPLPPSPQGHPLQALTTLDTPTPERKLRALWLRQSLNWPIEADWLQRLKTEPDEHVRAWLIRSATDAWPLDTVTSQPRAEQVTVPDDVLGAFVELAAKDPSGLVRLTLASTLQRLPVARRCLLAEALLSRAEDAHDHNLPKMIWYGLIPVALQDPGALVPLAAASQIPLVRIWAARRLAEIFPLQPEPLNALLGKAVDASDAVRSEILAGMTTGFAGIPKAKMPPNWPIFLQAFAPLTPERKSQVQTLNVIFGDGRALDELRAVIFDNKADLNLRKNALRTLIDARPADLREICESLLKVRYLNTVALDGLTRFNDPAVGRKIASFYRSFHNHEKAAVRDALASRPEFAEALLDLVGSGVIPRSDLSALHARQIQGFNKPELTKKLTEVWGQLRESSEDKAQLIASLKHELTPSRLAQADPGKGRTIFANACASCHRLFGSGGEIGPDLTGAGRKDLDYLLSNIIDPSAVVNKDYTMTVLLLADGRTVSGIVTGETESVIFVQTPKERLAIAKEEVDTRKPSSLSLMPDSLLQPLSRDQIADLIAYLMADAQVEPK